MRELNTEELSTVSAGVNPLLLGVGAGIVGNYIYDSIGGKEGIDNFFDSANDYLTEISYQRGDEILANPNGHGHID